MQNPLRSLILASVALAAAVLIAPSAMAATTINVLFPFTVGNQTCPAGHYLVVRDSNSYEIKLVGTDKSFIWSVQPSDPAPDASRVVLKFENIGSTHVLRAIQYGALTTSRIDKKPLRREIGSEIVLGK